MGGEGSQPEIGDGDSLFKRYQVQVGKKPETQIPPYRTFEIVYLKNIFEELDVKSSKSIEVEAFDHYYELRQHPLYERIRVLFREELEKLKQKRISFEIMLYLLIVFHIKTATQEKYRYAFRLYDWDKDFKLSVHDLSQTFQILLPSFREDTYVYMAEEFIREHGSNGFVKLEQFTKAIPEDQIKELMTLKFN